MKPLKINPSDLIQATTISQAHSPVEMKLIAPSTFVLIDRDSSDFPYAFDCPNLARFFKESDIPVANACMTEQRTIFGNHKAPFRELHIILEGGQSVTASESGKINTLLPFRAKFPQSASIYAPNSIWEIASNLEFGRILLTGRLVDAINEVSAEGQQTDTLNTLWHEYIAVSVKSATNPPPIQGEFFAFIVTDINDIKLFDLSKD